MQASPSLAAAPIVVRKSGTPQPLTPAFTGWFQPNGPWPGQINGETGQALTPFDNSLTPYKVALRRSGAEALFMVNMLTIDGRLAKDADNPRLIQDQVQFLQSAANAGVSLKRVELGNEFYLAGASAGANATDYSTRFSTASAYARQTNPWVSALRTAFPAVQIAAVGADATGNNAAPHHDGVPPAGVSRPRRLGH